MSYFKALSGFVEHRNSVLSGRGGRSHVRGLGKVSAAVWDDVSIPTAMAWFTADFSQRNRAFDLEQGRRAMRDIVSRYFVGASFFRTTGLYERVLSGGLAALVFGLMPSDERDQAAELVQFKERVRACAKHLAVFFEQDSVAAVVQAPNGHISLNFVGVKDSVDYTRFITPADVAAIQRLRKTMRRLDTNVVYGD